MDTITGDHRNDIAAARPDLHTAVKALAEHPNDMWDEIGSKLNCDEYEALAGLLRAVGLDGHARGLRLAHIEGEYPEDDHFDPTVSDPDGTERAS